MLQVRLIIAAVCVMVGLQGVAFAAPSEPGSAIRNQATMIYVDSASGETFEVVSNTSTVFVGELRQFTLGQSQTVPSFAGESVTYPHLVSNTGNVADSYAISTQATVPGGPELLNIKHYLDLNANGIVDAGEPLLPATFTLQPGESIGFIVTGFLPANLPGASIVETTVFASTTDGLLVEANINSAVVTAHANLELSLSSDVDCGVEMASGDTVNYTLQTTNTTNTLPEEQEFYIDGAIKKGVMLEVLLDPQASLVPDQELQIGAFQSIPVVQRNDQNMNWMSYAQWDGITRVDRVGLLVPASSFEGAEKVSITFSVLMQSLNSSLVQQIPAQAIVDLDRDGRVEFESNEICNSVIALQAALAQEIRFQEPALEIRRANVVPMFDNNEDFVDTPVYALSRDATLTERSSSLEYSLSRDGVYIELEADVLDNAVLRDANEVRHVVVNLISAKTGDTLKVVLRETRANTGHFRSIRPVKLSDTLIGDGEFCPGGVAGAQIGDADFESKPKECSLNSAANDDLTVEFTGTKERLLADAATVDPSGIVFDSLTLQSVPNTEVALWNEGGVALHPLTDEPLIVKTDIAGRYSLPRLSGIDDYFLRVIPPGAYTFPSAYPPTQFESLRVSDPSYGIDGFDKTTPNTGRFVVSADTSPPVVDIPLDRTVTAALMQVNKNVTQASVAHGDVVDYQIEVTNRSDSELTAAVLVDEIPFGMRYMRGSAQRDGERIADPTESNPGTLIFSVGDLALGQSIDINYRLEVTAHAVAGELVNSVVARADSISGVTIGSAQSQAVVRLEERGVFSNRATLFGKVYVDASCDGIQNKGEWPIAGVRLYMQDGSFVITDEDGLYSLMGLRPGLHVIKVDATTLPEGALLKPLDTRNAADADSRFVELTAGDFHRADFASSCPKTDPEKFLSVLKQRNARLRGSWVLEDAFRFDPNANSPLPGDERRADANGDIAFGTFSKRSMLDVSSESAAPVSASDTEPKAEGIAPGQEKVTEQVSNSKNVEQKPLTRKATPERARMGDPKVLAKTITTEQASAGTWLWPLNDVSLDGRFMVVVRSGIEPTLYINGVAVAESQIGERIVNNRTQAQLIAWYGVRLAPGVNRVEVRGKDAFQNERVLAKADMKRPSAGVKLAIKASSAVLQADGGESFTPVTVTVLDANNFPASGVYYITLDVDHGTIAEPDLQPDKPGVQVRVENGSITVPLRSSTHVGRVSFSAETGTMQETVSLQQTAPPRPLLVTGLVNIEQSFHESEDVALDQALQQEMDNDLKARIALFMKGKIKNDMQLTLAYDSEKNNDLLLRDVNPNEYYPTYGDASVRGFEAQSRSKLYLKLEKNLSSVTWGDYLTDAESTQLDLARVQRTLTGINVVHASDTGRLQVFAANVSDARETEEIRGNGTAMLYKIAGAPIVRNSDVVERIVRDADNIGVVIRTERLLRFSDYTIDPISGLLTFSDTVPSVDSELNPVFIRISYDRRSNLSEHLVAGVRVQQRYGENNLLESSLTADQNPLSGYILAGTSWQHGLGRNTTMKLSAATQHHNESGRPAGRAARVQMEHYWGGRRTHRSLLSWARATRHFTNPGSGLTAGREEWRAEHQQPLTRNVQLTAQATGSRAPGAKDGYTNASVKFNRNFGSWNLQWGGKAVHQYNESNKVDFNTVLLGAEKRFQFGRSARGTIGFEAERDASDAGRYSASVFSRLRVHKNAELYARYQRERQISLGTAASNNDATSRLIVGVESDVLPKTHVFSEYRLRGNDTGRSLETASGVRGRYEVKPKLDISPTLEVVDALEGDQAQDSVAVSVGLSDRRNPNRQLSAHAEARKTDAMRYFGARATMAQRLSPDWTALVREDYTRQAPSVGQLTSKHQLSVGMARRPKRDNRHHLLLLADWKEDYGPEDGMDRRTYMLSTHQNRQLSRSVSVSGRVGTKLQRIRYDDGDVRTNATLADARFMFDIRRRWEADLRFGWIGTRGAREQRYSLGVGLAWLAERNLRIGIAYNFMGFRDEDLDANGENAKGVKLGLQMKFDEDWFRWLEQ